MNIVIWYRSWIYYTPPPPGTIKLDPVLPYRGVGTDVVTQHEKKRIRTDDTGFTNLNSLILVDKSPVLLTLYVERREHSPYLLHTVRYRCLWIRWKLERIHDGTLRN
jgi:hypothetical protein